MYSGSIRFVLGFNSSNTIIENIRARFGSFDYFDLIYQSGSIYLSKDLRLASQHSPIMLREHECWGYRCLPWIIDDNASIVLQTFAYEMDLYHTSFSYNRVIGHSPTSAEPLVFYPPVALRSDTPPTRDIDLLVVGARHSFVYPLRTRMGEIVSKGLLNHSYVHAHPGYLFENSSVEQTESQMYAYAALLRRAKIVVMDSSRYGYALSKYVEAAMSGCLLLGEIPLEREEEFRRYVVEVSMNMTDEQILATVDYWIKHDHERETMATVGQRIVLESYTWDHSLDLSLQALLKHRRGKFGIYHSYPYSSTCIPFDNTNAASKWCPRGLRGIPLRSLCACNHTHWNSIHEEPDLDHWNALGVDSNSSNPYMHLVPTSFLTRCGSYQNISKFVEQSPGSLCRCAHADGSWRGSDICYVSNAALSISRYLAYLSVHGKKS